MSAHILIVDDNPTNLRLAASVLEAEGHVVGTAEDAEQALRYLDSAHPDLILMDVALPGMDGLSLTRLIGADPRWQDIPVVAVTAFAMASDELRAREAGCVGYLSKPINTRTFAAQVMSHLNPVQTPRRLLIVDDHPANLRLLRAQLEAEGVQSVEARNGIEALHQLASVPVDGVVSDILMPRMDGYRLCMELRRDPRWARLPVVLYTSTYDSPADRELAATAGADAYLSKPAPVAQLLQAIAAAGRRRRTHASAPVVAEPPLVEPVMQQYSESLVRKLEERSEELARAYEGLDQTRARLSGLVESAMDAIIAVNGEQRIVLFNGSAERMFGVAREQAIGEPLDLLIPTRQRDAHRSMVARFGEEPPGARRMGARMVWARRSDGSEFPIEASVSKLGTAEGWLYTVFARDISERYEAERALAASESSLRRVNRVMRVLSGINGLIVRATERDQLLQDACRIAVDEGRFPKAWIGLFDADAGRFRFAAGAGADPTFFDELAPLLENQQAAHYAGWREAMLAMKPVVVNDIASQPAELASIITSGSRSIAGLPLAVDQRAAGMLVLHADEADFFDEEELRLLTELADDISFALDHLGKAEQIRFLAHYDTLTRLSNRSLFVERLGSAMRAAEAHEDQIWVVLLDIERFSRVNETLGRAAGDELLQELAQRMQAANGSAARLVGNLFAAKLLRPPGLSDGMHEVERLLKACFDAPYLVQGNEVRLGCRTGIAIYPHDGDDAETLLRNAEAAIRQARGSAERCVFYAREFNALAAEALSLETRLRKAADNHEFILHYQPKVELGSRRIVGLEALIRWQDPGNGLVPPAQFVPLLEESGLIHPIGEFALRQALADQAAWVARGLPRPTVAVNVSPLQLRRADFAARVSSLLDGHDGARLELEITESVIMEDIESSIRTLHELRGAGITVAIDDFGTGYSSLAYIAKLPVTALKIDRSFITGMTAGPQGLAIVSAIVALAHALRLKVVAEGVETEEQARLLHLLGCDEAQGYLFARPQPAEAIAGLLG